MSPSSLSKADTGAAFSGFPNARYFDRSAQAIGFYSRSSVSSVFILFLRRPGSILPAFIVNLT
jgi:hypothetical protein